MPECITKLLSALNASGIPFAAEAWTEKPIGDAFGVVSIGAHTSLIADDGVAESMYTADVHLITFGDGFTESGKVETVLSKTVDSYSLTGRKYINSVSATQWTWAVEVL